LVKSFLEELSAKLLTLAFAEVRNKATEIMPFSYFQNNNLDNKAPCGMASQNLPALRHQQVVAVIMNRQEQSIELIID